MVIWREFRQDPMSYLTAGRRLKVRYGPRGAYMNIYFHPAYPKDMGYSKEVLDGEAKEVKKECSLCGWTFKVRYIIPYDGSKAPGDYCYWCRRKYSLMDIKNAKRYGKIL